MHVAPFGWIDTHPAEWMLALIRHPDPWPTYADPGAERERVAEVLRARHEREHPPHQPWPAPEIPMRVIDVAAAPGAVARLAGKLLVADWRVVVTYCRGSSLDAQRRPGRVVDSYALRSAYCNRRAVAIWTGPSDGRLTSAGVLVWGEAPARWIGVKAFEEGL